MTEEIRPALSPEQWATERDASGADWDAVLAIYLGISPERTDARHAVAALALHGQPFGFTWADVEALLTEASVLSEGEDADPFTYQVSGWLRDLADRIAALLPPREQP